MISQKRPGQIRFLFAFFVLLTLAACFEPKMQSPAESDEPPVTLRSSVSKAQVEVGETVSFIIELRSKSGIDVELPQVGDQIQRFRILSERIETPRSIDDQNSKQRVYVLAADQAGSYVLPEVHLNVDTPEGAMVLKTPKLFVEVGYTENVSESDAQGLRDIKPLMESKINWMPILFWTVGLLVLLPLIVALFWYLKRWSSQKTTAEAKVLPHQWALNELKILQQNMGQTWDLTDQELRKRFYFRISEIMRVYIEKRFSISAIEKTTEEILPSMKKHPDIHNDIFQQLDTFFQKTDLVKFTDVIPSEQDPAACLNIAQHVILHTKREPEVLEMTDKREAA